MKQISVRARRSLTAVGTAAIAAGMVLTATTPASATVTKFCTLAFAKAGYACFYSSDDRVEVLDNFADGLRSVVVWYVADNGNHNKILDRGECHNAKGAGKTVTCDYDFPEGRQIFINFAVVARDGANGANQHPSNAIIGYVSGK
ncbi:hypothetical protein GCM10023084_09640 [Streptomyces lacrimifluminis]|uniref:Uncharacterized protein n=1 Tax=Streptomyces lacrimifluminis TaxID=1500077 RepID=A0A917KPC0_9ACTN|nr:hypothetical protein [Streptomyces lacrimifluminis]GGJ23638.1 hypothetical protein GCM10012282_20220 [Streptomyces lacrimifluminis]